MGIEGSTFGRSKGAQNACGQNTAAERNQFLKNAYMSFREALREAQDEFSISFAFCFLSLSDNKIMDHTTNEIIPGSMIVDGQITVDDLFIQIDSLEEMDAFVEAGSFISSALLVRLIMDPKDISKEVLVDSNLQQLISYSPTFCIADLGVYESVSSSEPTRTASVIRAANMPKSIQHIKTLALQMNQPFLTTNLAFSENHVSLLLGEYLGGFSNSCQTCMVLFSDPESPISPDCTLEAFKFGEIIRAVKVRPMPHENDIFALEKANHLSSVVTGLTEDLNLRTGELDRLGVEFMNSKRRIGDLETSLVEEKSQRELMELESAYRRSCEVFDETVEKIDHLEWKAKDLVRKYQLACDSVKIELLSRKNNLLEKETVELAKKMESLKDEYIEKELKASLAFAEEKAKLQDQLAMKDRELSLRLSDLQSLQVQSKSLSMQLDAMKSDTSTAKTTKNLEIKEKLLEIESLHKEIRYLEADRQSITLKLASLEKENRNLERLNTKLQVEIESIRTTDSSLRHQVSNNLTTDRKQFEWIQSIENKLNSLEQTFNNGDLEQAKKQLNQVTQSNSRPSAGSRSLSKRLEAQNENPPSSQLQAHVQESNESPINPTKKRTTIQSAPISEDEFSFDRSNNLAKKSVALKGKKKKTEEEDPENEPKKAPLPRGPKRKSIVMPKAKSGASSHSDTEEDVSQFDINLEPFPNQSTNSNVKSSAAAPSARKLGNASKAEATKPSGPMTSFLKSKFATTGSSAATASKIKPASSSKKAGLMDTSTFLSKASVADISTENSGFLSNLSFSSDGSRTKMPSVSYNATTAAVSSSQPQIDRPTVTLCGRLACLDLTNRIFLERHHIANSRRLYVKASCVILCI